ncbi:TrkA family potassium uptake protein [Balneola sp. MJW-20]|uniref:potassium channel family protein n=1 Tax=Gracilimonas aurantiaca TaxID=3234185 RepID=UPI0034679F57
MKRNTISIFNLENSVLFRIGMAFLLLITIFIIGTSGYHFLEGMKWFDGLYMTFITITTIGFSELKSLTVEGRVFTMIIFVMGIGVISYIASQSTQLIFESELFFKRAMTKRLEKLEDHYIICGYGRIGHRIAEVLTNAGLPIVIVENRESSIQRIRRDNLLYVEGDAEEEQSLLDAGINKAKALICTLSSDQDNVFTTLLARELNRDIFILVRANESRNRRKALRAGANKVLSPYDIGADRMANVILRPNVDHFIDNISKDQYQEHSFDEAHISEDSVLAGKSLLDINVRKEYSVLIIAIIREDGQTIFNPDSSVIINEGDSLILLGDQNKIQKFRKVVCDDHRTLSERAEHFEKLSKQ